MRHTQKIVLAGLCLAILAPAVPAFAKGDSASSAKRKAEQAQQAANAAAAELNKAQSAYDQLGNSISKLQRQLQADQSHMAALKSAASARAVNAYMGASNNGVAATDPVAALDERRREELFARANGQSQDAVSKLAVATEDLQTQKSALESQRSQQTSALERLKLQQKNLQDKLKLAQAAEKQVAVLASSSKSGRGTGYSPGAVIVNPGGSSFSCPIVGPLAFTNDWGAPRSGGRRHKGNDLFSSRGTPNVAVVSGRVFYQDGGLGGKSAYVVGNNGVTYFYAHLSQYIGGARTVSQGEVVGLTGNTGNARSGLTHTHFEIRLGGPGGLRINPYPTLSRYCRGAH